MSTWLPENPYYIARRAYYNHTWETGSFLVLSDTTLLLQGFYDLQLKPESQELALTSLLRFLDSQYPDDITLFLGTRARDLKRVAFRWLASGEARRFWGSDEKHIQHNEMTEDFGVLEWSDPDDCDEMVYTVKELLVMMKPMMMRFYEVRENYTVEGQERRLLEDESEDEDGGVGLSAARTAEDHDEDDDEDEDEDEDSEDEDDEDEEPAKISGQKRKRSDDDSEDESQLHKKPLTIRAK